LFQHYLDKGFTPVTFGDVVLDKTLGFSICSGDLLIKKIAEHFKPEKAIFVLDEDGLYTSNPKIDPHATFIPQATTHDLNSLTTTADTHADVTQGMQGKIETIKHIAALDIPTYLINGKIQNRLLNTLTGKKTTHTIIIGEKK
jgi:isopentenyl phosphate kinase